MRIKAFSAETLQDLLLGLHSALSEGLKPTLGFIFCSVSMDIEKASQALGEFDFPFFGSSSYGEILLNRDESQVSKRSAVVALLEMPTDCFELKLFDEPELPPFALGTEIGRWGQSVFERPAFVMAKSGLKKSAEEVIRGMISSFADSVPIFGGLASDDAQFSETFVFTNTFCSRTGSVVCVFDRDKVAIDGISTSGWVGVGAPMVITASDDNMVFSLNDSPALELYTRYLGLDPEDLPGIAIEYPLQLLSPDSTHVLRAVVGVDRERNALIFGGSMPQGSQVRFSISPGFETVENSRKDFERFHEEFPTPDLLLVFSCMARLLALGPVVDQEIRTAQCLWNTPGLGFFCYGEFGKNSVGRYDFFNETCSLVLLKLK